MSAKLFFIPSMTHAQAIKMCDTYDLCLVQDGRGNLEVKRKAAVEYLRSRSLYILDRGSKRPGWGHGPKERA